MRFTISAVRVSASASQAVQAADHGDVLASDQMVVDGGELARQADALPHPGRVADDVVSGDAHGAAVRTQQGGEDADRVVLPAPFGPSSP
jgi:hypothetical protein